MTTETLEQHWKNHVGTAGSAGCELCWQYTNSLVMSVEVASDPPTPAPNTKGGTIAWEIDARRFLQIASKTLQKQSQSVDLTLAEAQVLVDTFRGRILEAMQKAAAEQIARLFAE